MAMFARVKRGAYANLKASNKAFHECVGPVKRKIGSL
jgi:hypothetical protein